jgi:hypothetical protein
MGIAARSSDRLRPVAQPAPGQGDDVQHGGAPGLGAGRSAAARRDGHRIAGGATTCRDRRSRQDLLKYLVLSDLQARNETPFYTVLMTDPATYKSWSRVRSCSWLSAFCFTCCSMGSISVSVYCSGWRGARNGVTPCSVRSRRSGTATRRGLWSPASSSGASLPWPMRRLCRRSICRCCIGDLVLALHDSGRDHHRRSRGAAFQSRLHVLGRRSLRLPADADLHGRYRVFRGKVRTAANHY